MSRLSPVSLSDLLMVRKIVADAQLDEAAAPFGFRRVLREKVASSTGTATDSRNQESHFAGIQRQTAGEQPSVLQSSSGDPQGTGPQPDVTPDAAAASVSLARPTLYRFPGKLEKLKLWRAGEAETLMAPGSPSPAGAPISDQDLHLLRHHRKLRSQPLVPWRRLGPFIRRRTGQRITAKTIDLRKLIQKSASGKVVTEIPRVARLSWSRQLAVVCDRSREMQPFADDINGLLRQLRVIVGAASLLVVRMESCFSHLSVPATTPILLLSSLGLLQSDGFVQIKWQQLGMDLQNRGHLLTALAPVPPALLGSDVAVAWNAVSWDLGQRFPRQMRRTHVSAPAATARTASQQAAETLLDLLATAARIDPALLRQARARLRREDVNANALAEYLAWHHPDCWQSVSCCGLKPGEPYVRRLSNRQQLYTTNPQLVNDVQALIDQQHSAYSCAIELETSLRSWNQRTQQQQQESQTLLQRIIDRLRQLALEPASPEGTRSGLPAWFNDMIQRLPPQIRSTEQLAPLIAEGLALTDTWLQAERELPAGVAEHVYREQLQAAEQRVETGQQLEMDVGLQGTELVLQTAGRQQRPWWPLAQLRAVTSKHLTVSLVSDTGERQLLSRMLHPGAPERIALPADARSLLLETPAARLQLHKVPRPNWASRFWQDAAGTAAEFRIGDVPFVMRWIPPGRFLMGSPDDERGRYPREGPQHEVTISRGYWLGQTPVTQQQWQAVVQAALQAASGSSQRSRRSAGSAAAAGGSQLKAELSRFSGNPLHPVESVNWHQCVQYCQLVQGLLGNELQFRLPSEAEWEYACRAGTSGAFKNGSACTEPQGTDPALEKLGWYTKNSGGKTQPVGLKQSNGWGLYDMHGNVWEWCRDGQRAYGAEPQVNPVGSESSGASRVLRGGSWGNRAGQCRAASRDTLDPGLDWGNTGLRLSAGNQ